MERDTKARKALDIRVLGTMRDCGHLDHLNAEFLSGVSEVAQEANFESVKPYKFLRKSLNDRIAASLVIKFLEQNNMQYTLKSLQCETAADLQKVDEKAEKTLGFRPGDRFWELVHSWVNGGNEAVIQNREGLRNALQHRVELVTRTPRKDAKK
jgi:hypothetical protein